MKIVALLARILLGLVFVFFGLNGFLRFLPDAGLPPVRTSRTSPPEAGARRLGARNVG